MAYFLCVLGMVFVIEGLPYIICPGRVKFVARQIQTMSDKNLQRFGLIAAFVGVGIVYFGKQLGGI